LTELTESKGKAETYRQQLDCFLPFTHFPRRSVLDENVDMVIIRRSLDPPRPFRILFRDEFSEFQIKLLEDLQSLLDDLLGFVGHEESSVDFERLVGKIERMRGMNEVSKLNDERNIEELDH